MPQIRVLLGHQQGHVFSLVDRPLVIGRDPNADLVLHPDSAASRRHAEIFPENGSWRVRDLGSVNGTALNGRPIRNELLQDNDEVIIGDNVFVFENTEPDVSRIAEAASLTVPVDLRGYHNRPDVQALVRGLPKLVEMLGTELENTFRDARSAVRAVYTALISRGHVLASGGTSATMAVLSRRVAESLSLKFGHVSFAPELLSSDLSGRVFLEVNDETGKKELRFMRGPIFTNIFLATDANRAPAKTQVALFNAMRENRVSAGGETWSLDAPFFVVASQHLTDAEASSPLNDEKLEAFMLTVDLSGAAAGETERGGSGTAGSGGPIPRPLALKQVLALQAAARDLPAGDHVITYAIRLVRATRPADKTAPHFVHKYVLSGAGPRAAQDLLFAAKGNAMVQGRLFVTTDDVRGVVKSVLRHRLVTNFTADADGMDASAIIAKLVESVEEPEAKDE